MISFPLIVTILVAYVRLINSNEYGTFRPGSASSEPITTDLFTTDIVNPVGDGNNTESNTEVYDDKRFLSSDEGNEFVKKCDETRTLKNCLGQIANDSKHKIKRNKPDFHIVNHGKNVTEISSFPAPSTEASELLDPQLTEDTSGPVIHLELSTSNGYHDESNVTTVELKKLRENGKPSKMSTPDKLPLSTSTTTRIPGLKRNEKVRTWNIRSTTPSATETFGKIKNIGDNRLVATKRPKIHELLKLAHDSRQQTPEQSSTFGTIRYSRPIQKPASGSNRPLSPRPTGESVIHKQLPLSTVFSSVTTTLTNILESSLETSTAATSASFVIFNETRRNGSIDKLSQEIPWPVKKEAIVEGDIILGGLMMVHEREDSITCGPVMPQGGIQALEAMLFTLDQLNSALDPLLPNITLGAHILDDCDKDTYGLEMAVDFIKGSTDDGGSP